VSVEAFVVSPPSLTDGCRGPYTVLVHNLGRLFGHYLEEYQSGAKITADIAYPKGPTSHLVIRYWSKGLKAVASVSNAPLSASNRPKQEPVPLWLPMRQPLKTAIARGRRT
jgi:hypothetical protein